MHFPLKVALLASLCLLTLINLGCDPPAEISSYDVPVKETKPVASQDDSTSSALQMPAANRQPVEQRMLVATILRGNTAWFIKTMGSPNDVADAAGQMRGLIDGLSFPEDKPNDISWTVPEGWSTRAGNQFRAATLVLPKGDPPLEVAISKLGYPGNRDEYLLMNVNRWRGQVGLDPVDKVDSAAGVESIDVKGVKVWMFDGTGKSAGSGMMPPFARRRPSPPSQPSRPAAPASPKITVKIPEGWKEGEKGSMGSRSYLVGQGEDKATCKISDFAAFGMMGDPLSNVNRWRRQMGLEPVDQAQLDEQSEKVSISEADGILVSIDRPDESERMLASMAVKGGRVWFFQMTGSPKALDTARESFVEMLGSVNIAVPETGEEGE